MAGAAAAFAAASAFDEALAQPTSDDGSAIPFNSNSSLVEEAARSLASKPFVPPNSDLPGPLSNLSYDAYVGIHAKPESLIWAQDPSGFVIEPLHRGFVFGTPMQINLVEGGLARRLNYDAANFTFGGVTMNTPPVNLDFSGFRILQRGPGGALREFAIFQGASFFRSNAPGQTLGVNARGLSIRTGDARGEEFPFFRAVWIEKTDSGRQRPDDSRPARFPERYRRLSLHPASGRGDHSGHRMLAVSPRGPR